MKCDYGIVVNVKVTHVILCKLNVDLCVLLHQ